MSVPLGDSLARVNLLQGGSDQITRNGFLQGENHVDDLDE